MNKKPDIILYASDQHGIYIPEYFARSIKRDHVKGVEDWSVLEAGPFHDDYWDVWDEVLSDAEITDDKGNVYFLHQDGDLWLIPRGMEWNDSKNDWEWPFEGESFTAPACWAPYLINGDASGLEDEDLEECNRVTVGLGHCVDAIDVGFLSHPDYGLAGDCCEYRFQTNN